MLAAHLCKLDVVLALLDRGADINAKSRCGLTALHLAASSHPRIIEALIHRVVDVNHRDCHGRTALVEAMASNYGFGVLGQKRVPAASFLVAENIDVDLPDNEGRTALWYAVQRPADALALLDAGADPDMGDPARIVDAPPQVMLALLDNGARAGATGDAERTALHGLMDQLIRDPWLEWPDARRVVSLIQALKKGGCPIDGREERLGHTAIHKLFAIRLNLADAGPKSPDLIDRPDNGFYILPATRLTPERTLARYPDVASAISTCLKALIEQGAQVEARDNTGRTALHQICVSEAPEDLLPLLQALHENGADISAPDSDGQTALHIICRDRAPDDLVQVCRALLDRGADINARDSSGSSPLHAFAHNVEFWEQEPDKARFDAVMDLLLSHGAAMDAVDDRGRSFFDSWFHKQYWQYMDLYEDDNAEPSFEAPGFLHMEEALRLTDRPEYLPWKQQRATAGAVG